MIVRDATADYWPRLAEELNKARGHFSGIRETDPPAFATALPALVAYKGGVPVLQVRGVRAVNDVLVRITRDEFSLTLERS